MKVDMTYETQRLVHFANQLNHERLRDQFLEKAQEFHQLGHLESLVRILVKMARMHNHQAIRERRAIQ
jgi:hypothetical protein